MGIIRRWRRRAAIVTHAKEIEQWIDRMEHYAPCRNPDCQDFRKEMRAIVNNTRRDPLG